MPPVEHPWWELACSEHHPVYGSTECLHRRQATPTQGFVRQKLAQELRVRLLGVGKQRLVFACSKSPLSKKSPGWRFPGKAHLVVTMTRCGFFGKVRCRSTSPPAPATPCGSRTEFPSGSMPVRSQSPRAVAGHRQAPWIDIFLVPCRPWPHFCAPGVRFAWHILDHGGAFDDVFHRIGGNRLSSEHNPTCWRRAAPALLLLI